MADNGVTDDDLAELVELASEATTAFIGGDMRRYFTLIDHADDFTLMSPTGGAVTVGPIAPRSTSRRWRGSSRAAPGPWK